MLCLLLRLDQRTALRAAAPPTLQLVVAVEVVVAAKVAAAAGGPAGLLVDLGDDGGADVLDLLELLLEVVLLGLLVVVEPLETRWPVLESLLDGLLVVITDLVGDALLGVGYGANPSL